MNDEAAIVNNTTYKMCKTADDLSIWYSGQILLTLNYEEQTFICLPHIGPGKVSTTNRVQTNY